jgi:hypothetical protein
MPQEVGELSLFTLRCPLCDEEVSLPPAAHRVPAQWREAFRHRQILGELSEQFRARQSIELAARELSISAALGEYLLQFLCREICGCRTVTCVSCLDDYRNLL